MLIPRSEEWLFDVGENPDLEGHHITVRRWLDRGDGCAVYENMAMDSALLGHRKYTNFGSPAAQLEVDDPPVRIDITFMEKGCQDHPDCQHLLDPMSRVVSLSSRKLSLAIPGVLGRDLTDFRLHE